MASVTETALPPAARALCTLSRIDYEDAFLLDISAGPVRTPEQWARAIIADAAPPLRRTLPWGWLALGLRLDSPRSEHSVLGWEVRRSTPELALLAGRSRIGMPAELLFQLHSRPDQLLFATFVQHQNPAVRALWAGVAPLHRQIVRYLLVQATGPRRSS